MRATACLNDVQVGVQDGGQGSATNIGIGLHVQVLIPHLYSVGLDPSSAAHNCCVSRQLSGRDLTSGCSAVRLEGFVPVQAGLEFGQEMLLILVLTSQYPLDQQLAVCWRELRQLDDPLTTAIGICQHTASVRTVTSKPLARP